MTNTQTTPNTDETPDFFGFRNSAEEHAWLIDPANAEAVAERKTKISALHAAEAQREVEREARNLRENPDQIPFTGDSEIDFEIARTWDARQTRKVEAPSIEDLLSKMMSAFDAALAEDVRAINTQGKYQQNGYAQQKTRVEFTKAADKWLAANN